MPYGEQQQRPAETSPGIGIPVPATPEGVPLAKPTDRAGAEASTGSTARSEGSAEATAQLPTITEASAPPASPPPPPTSAPLPPAQGTSAPPQSQPLAQEAPPQPQPPAQEPPAPQPQPQPPAQEPPAPQPQSQPPAQEPPAPQPQSQPPAQEPPAPQPQSQPPVQQPPAPQPQPSAQEAPPQPQPQPQPQTQAQPAAAPQQPVPGPQSAPVQQQSTPVQQHQPPTPQQQHTAAPPQYAPQPPHTAPTVAPTPTPTSTPTPQNTFSSLPLVDDSLTSPRRKPLHGEPLVGRALRAVRRTVSSSASREVAVASQTAQTLQQPVTTGRQIAVTSIRGGAGKSTVAALLGKTYAHYRHDPVLLVEADPALGTLPSRLGAPSLRWTVRDLAELVEPAMSLLDVTGYLVQLPDNAWLLPGSKGEVGAMLDTRAYEKAMVALRRYFGVTVVDCETLPAEVARTALSAAQARVLVAPATYEGIASTHSVLRWMAGLPRHVVAGTVVVLTEAVPHGGLDADKAAERLRATGATVHLLPYDRHLAAGGGINPELLAHTTRETATQVAADALHLSLQARH